MATTTKESKATGEVARKEIFIPRGQQNDDPNFFVSVNGPNTIMPKGQTHKLTEAEVYEIERSRRAQEALDRKMEAMLEANK